MKILVAGATGQLGRAIVAKLKQRGHRTRALTRRPGHAPPEADEVAAADLLHYETLHEACAGVDVVVSAAGASLQPTPKPGLPDYWAVDYRGNLNLLQAAQAAGVRRFVYVSVYRVPALDGLAYVRAHEDVARVLQQANLSAALIRPTGFFSAFAIFPKIARLGVMPLIGTGEGRTNPIHEYDLADVCADAVENSEQVTIDIGGPEVLTRRTIAELAFRAVGRTPRLVPMPDGLLTLVRRGFEHFDPRFAQLLAFLQAVNHVDVVAPPHGQRRLEAYFREIAG